jgi:hypothetical protein
MTLFSKLGDDLMKVPKLEAGGVNWVVYKDRFLWSVDARGLLEHVDGSEREPVCPVKPRFVPKRDADGKETTDMVRAMLSADEERLMKEWKAELKEWKQGEAIVKQQVAATIPDSLFMKIRDKGTALEIWEALRNEFQNKSRMVAVDLRRRLQQEHCAEKGDVRLHFSKLRLMREDLAAMGHPPGDDEFYAIILGSLPYSFEPFISALNATSSVLGTILSPDELMQALTDEYDRRNLRKSSKRDENTENVAFSTEEGNSRKGNGQKGKCYNCGKPGHRKDDCWEEGGGKEDQKPNWLKEKEKWRQEKEEGSGKEKDKLRVKDFATTANAEEDMAWMASCPSDSEDDDPLSALSIGWSLEDFIEVDEDLRQTLGTARKCGLAAEKREKVSEKHTFGKTACIPTPHENPTGEKPESLEFNPWSTEIWVPTTSGSKLEEESLDWWDEPVEGKREKIDEQVTEAGNQPNPQPAEPEPEDVDWPNTPQVEDEPPEAEELLPAQPEEQGRSLPEIQETDPSRRRKVNPNPEDDAESIPDMDNAATWLADAGVILHALPLKTLRKSAWKYYSDAIESPLDEIEGKMDGGMWLEEWQMENCLVIGPDKGLVPEIEREMIERDKMTYLDIEIGRDLEIGTISPSQHPYAESIPARSNFDNAERVSIPMDPNTHLSKAEPPPIEADLAKTEDLLCRAFGFTTYAPTGTNPFEVPTAAEILEEPDATYAEAVHCDFRPKKGTGDVRLAFGDEENGLQNLPNPGEAPQHSREGYKPIMDERSSLDQSKGARDAISTVWKGGKAGAIGALDKEVRNLIWEDFPPAPGINKPPSGINKRTYLITTRVRT